MMMRLAPAAVPLTAVAVAITAQAAAAAGDEADDDERPKDACPDGDERCAPADDDGPAGTDTDGDTPLGALSGEFIPGDGLRIRSRDGNFGLTPSLRAQLLAAYGDSPSAPAELGMLLRRARLEFNGHLFGEHNKFKAEFAFSPRDLDMAPVAGTVVPRESPLLSWYAYFDYARDASVRAGQYKIPFSRQRVVSSADLQLVDRSEVQGEFNLDRDIGVDLRSEDLLGLDRFRYYAGVYNGEGRSATGTGDSNLLLLARFEYLPFGSFEDYRESDLERRDRPGLSLGAAYAYADDARGTRVNRGAPADGGTTDFHVATADAVFKYAGASVVSEVYLRDGTRNPGGATDGDGTPIPTEAPRNGVGWFVQAGYLLPARFFEVAARVGQVRARGDSSLVDRSEAGLGASYFFAQHAFKLQADVFQTWDDGSDGVTRVRVQLQLTL